MSSLWRDFRFGLRLLWKHPGFASVAILALALGIGANTAIFSVVYGTFLAPLPYPRPKQLVVVWSKVDGRRNVVSAGDFLDWKAQSTAFQELSAITGRSFNLSTSSEPELVISAKAPPGLFSRFFEVGPFLGRDFLPEEGELGKDHVVILSHRLWERRFGGNRGIIGQQIHLDGEAYTVVGVLPTGTYDRFIFQLWVPLAFKPEQINHDFHWLVVTGRLKPNVTREQAQADMDGVTRRVAEAYPISNKSWGAMVEPFQNDFFDRDLGKTLWLLFGAVSVVLLIACANVANLLLVRGISRQKEVAIRASLGATRRQLFGQFLAESLTLATIGGIVGVCLAWVILRVLVASIPPYSLPPEADIRLSWLVLGFTLAITAVAGALSGFAPAWQAARPNLNEALKEGGRTGLGSSRQRLGRVLVTVEFALALTLLAGAGLLLHSVWNMRYVDLGIRKDHVLTFSLQVPPERFSQPEQIVEFWRQMLDKIDATPGVTTSGASSGRPVQNTGFGMPFSIVGQPVADPSSLPGVGFQMVTPGYYETFGIRVVRGRMFTEQDIAGRVRVAMVSETFVKRYLAGVDPLTQRVAVERLIPGVTRLGLPIEWQIVGVFHNVKYGGLGNSDDRGEIDVPFWQSPWPGADVAVRTTGDPASMTKSVAAAIQSIDPGLALDEVKTMEQVVTESSAGTRLESVLLASFAGTALLLAALGIYGVMAFSVAQRTHEIGMRMALGAGRGQILRLVLRQGMILAFAGVVIGLAGALFAQQLMRSQLLGIGRVDIGSLGVVVIALMFASVLACYIPARRATQVDPFVALRE